MPKTLTVTAINKRLRPYSYTCISYDIHSKKFKYVCQKGHKNSMRMDHWNRGVRCPNCNGNKKLTLDYVVKQLSFEGYSVLSSKYINSNTPLSIKCNEGHISNMSWNNWHSGHRCLECSGKKKITYNKVLNNFKVEGYTLKSTEYLSNKQLLDCTCPNKHTYRVSYDNFFNKGVRCPKCTKWGSSKAESAVSEFISSFYTGTIINNDRNLLDGKELDIILPDLNLAIEYCGLYWHSLKNGKDYEYHVNKLESCLSKNYHLITLFEDEWVSKKDITKSRLRYYIDTNNCKKIDSSNCYVKEVGTQEANSFYNKNHLQGYYVNSLVNLGAFCNNKLIAVMSFSRHCTINNRRYDKNNAWEICRFCFRLNYMSTKIPYKLLKYFECNFNCSELLAFVDRRWSVGSAYKKLGFKVLYNTNAICWYFKNNKKRIPSCVELTCNSIWDCGNVKLHKVIN